MAEWTPPEVQISKSNWEPPEISPKTEADSLFKQPLEQAAVGYRTGRQPAPEELAKRQEQVQKQFAYDPSMRGQVPISEYLAETGKGAAIGGGIGLGMGAITGPGALLSGGIGAAAGGAGGLLSTIAKDVGLGPAFQAMASMAVPVPGQAAVRGAAAPIKSAVGDVMERLSPATSPVSEFLQKLTAHSMFGYPGYLLATATKKIKGAMPPDVRALEEAVGVKAATRAGKLEAGTVQFREAAENELRSQYGIAADQAPVNTLYEAAKSSYDATGGARNLLSSAEYLALKQKDPALASTFMKLFQQSKNVPYSGDRAIANVRDFLKGTEATITEKNTLRSLVESNWKEYALADQAANKMFVAKAMDTVPDIMKNIKDKSTFTDSVNLLKKEMENLAQTKESRQVFWSELFRNSREVGIDYAQKIWSKIGPDVRQHMIKDKATYQKITDVFNGAKTYKDIDRAYRLLGQAIVGYGVSE